MMMRSAGLFSLAILAVLDGHTGEARIRSQSDGIHHRSPSNAPAVTKDYTNNCLRAVRSVLPASFCTEKNQQPVPVDAKHIEALDEIDRHVAPPRMRGANTRGSSPPASSPSRDRDQYGNGSPTLRSRVATASPDAAPEAAGGSNRTTYSSRRYNHTDPIVEAATYEVKMLRSPVQSSSLRLVGGDRSVRDDRRLRG